MPKNSSPQETRDFLLRDLPVEVANKLKVAASLHHVPMKKYIQNLLENHLSSLERQGVKLTLETKKKV